MHIDRLLNHSAFLQSSVPERRFDMASIYQRGPDAFRKGHGTACAFGWTIMNPALAPLMEPFLRQDLVVDAVHAIYDLTPRQALRIFAMHIEPPRDLDDLVAHAPAGWNLWGPQRAAYEIEAMVRDEIEAQANKPKSARVLDRILNRKPANVRPAVPAWSSTHAIDIFRLPPRRRAVEPETVHAGPGPMGTLDLNEVVGFDVAYEQRSALVREMAARIDREARQAMLLPAEHLQERNRRTADAMARTGYSGRERYGVIREVA